MALPDTTLGRISLRDILYVIFSKIKILIGIFVTIVGVTMAVSFLVDPVYETSATVLLKPTIDSSVLAQAAPGSLRPLPVTQQDINSEIQILSSRSLLKEVVLKLELYKSEERKKLVSRLIAGVLGAIKRALIAVGLSEEVDPVEGAVIGLEEALEIEPVTMSNMIQVLLTGDNPTKIANTVNTLVDMYIDRHIAVHQARGSLEFFAEQTRLYAKKLAEAEKALQEFQAKWSISDLKAQQAANVELLKTLRQNLLAVRSRIAEEQTRLSALKEGMVASGRIKGLTRDLRQSAAVIELTKSLVPLLVERERIGLLYPKDSVEYQDAQRQAAEVQEAIDREMKRILRGSEVDLGALMAHEKALADEIKLIEAETNFLTEKETALERLKRELRQAEKNYLLYSDKTEEARISEQEAAARVANVSVASWADEPSVPIFPKKMLLGLASIVVGLIAGVAGAFLSHYLDHTVKTPDELARHARLPVLAALADVEAPKRGKPKRV